MCLSYLKIDKLSWLVQVIEVLASIQCAGRTLDVGYKDGHNQKALYLTLMVTHRDSFVHYYTITYIHSSSFPPFTRTDGNINGDCTCLSKKGMNHWKKIFHLE